MGWSHNRACRSSPWEGPDPGGTRSPLDLRRNVATNVNLSPHLTLTVSAFLWENLRKTETTGTG